MASFLSRLKPAPRSVAELPTGAPTSALKPVKLLAASAVGLLVLYGAALDNLRPPSPGQEVTLDTLVREAPRGTVKTAKFLDEDARVVGTLVDADGDTPTQFWTSYPRSDAATNDLLKSLLSSNAQVTVDSQTSKATVRFVAQFLLPLIILANLFALLFYLSRQGASGLSEYLTFGRLGQKRLAGDQRPRTTFADLAGAEGAVVELTELRDYLADPSAFQRMGALPPKGVLLVGPPGCGKTLLARAVAGEAEAAFFSISGSEFVESLVGVGAARVRDLFRQALVSTPAIIFIDELDGAGRQRGTGLGGGHDEREQTLNELLVQMDGFSPNHGLVVLGATNRPDILDPALLRAGRFDRRVTVERPAVEERLAILRLHAKARRLQDADSDLPHVARRTPGFTGADLANVVNEAALLAVRSKSEAVARRHLDEAVERVLGGPRPSTRIIPPHEKRQIAIHESGHAVVAAAMGKADQVDKVSVIAHGAGVGHLALLSEEKLVFTRQDMEMEVTVAMAGVAAEELVLGQPSTGAEADLERATRTAKDMAGRYGMSPRLGRVRVLREQGEVFLGRDYLLNAEVSQPTLEHLDGEVRRILEEQEHLARSILSAHRGVLDALTSALSSDETLEGPDLKRLLAQVPTYPTSGVNRPLAPARAGSTAGEAQP